MLRRRTRIVQGIALAVTSVVALAGCGGGGSGSSTSGSDGGSPTAGTIQWWSWTPDNDVAERDIAEFNKQYPDIKVTYKKVPNADYTAVLRPALASDSGPDVFTMAAAGTVGPFDVFGSYATDLTPKVAELLGPDWKSKVYESGVSAFSKDDKLKAMPFAKVAAGNMWINRAMFDKYDVKVPTNLAEWTQACQTFRSNGLGCFKEGIGASGFDVDTLHSIVNSIEPGLWLQATTDKVKWTDPRLVQAWTIFSGLQSSKILDPGGVGVQQYPDVNNAFLSGKVPMVQMGSWYAQYSTVNSLTSALQGAGVPANTPKVAIEPITFPDVAGKGNPATLFTDPDAAQAVNAKSKSLNAATTFALWLGGTTQGQASVANNVDSLPTLAGVTPDWDNIKLIDQKVQEPLLKDLYAKAADASDPRNRNLPAARFQAVSDANQAVLGGSKTPEQAAADVQAAFDANPIGS